MKTRSVWLPMLLVACLCAGVGVVGAAGPAGAAPADTAPSGPVVTGAVAYAFSYQGRVTGAAGDPLDGAVTMRFRLYPAPVGAGPLWDSGDLEVTVTGGLFSVTLSPTPLTFDGRALWLQVVVGGEPLVPMQEVLAVPYALALRPGAFIMGQESQSAPVVQVMAGNPVGTTTVALQGAASTGHAVRGESANGYGLSGYSENGYAVYGRDAGTAPSRGYAGYFESTNGIAVYGHSSASISTENGYAPGVYGRSEQGTGVYGLSEGFYPGVMGRATGTGPGVRAMAGNADGLLATSSSTDENHAAVRGVAQTTTGIGIGVLGQYDGFGAGVLGTNTQGSAVIGDNTGSYVGVWADSAAENGVEGNTDRTDHNYGLYTADNIYSLNYHTAGAVMQVVQSAEAEALETGDVVEIAGLEPAPARDDPPVMRVRLATAGSTGVIGVVVSGYDAAHLMAERNAMGSGSGGPAALATEGPVAEGQYLLVAVQGLARVKVAAGATFAPGDLLIAAAGTATAGTAARAVPAAMGADPAAPGTIIGKALEGSDGTAASGATTAGDDALVYVYVTLR